MINNQEKGPNSLIKNEGISLRDFIVGSNYARVILT